MIDVGQAVDVGHLKSGDYLARDLSVITDFFRRKGVTGCLEAAQATRFVIGYRGPFECARDGEPVGKGTDDSDEVGEEGEGPPPTGYAILLEVRVASAESTGRLSGRSGLLPISRVEMLRVRWVPPRGLNVRKGSTPVSRQSRGVNRSVMASFGRGGGCRDVEGSAGFASRMRAGGDAWLETRELVRVEVEISRSEECAL